MINIDGDKALLAVGVVWIASMIVSAVTEDFAYKFVKSSGRSYVGVAKQGIWRGWAVIERAARWIYWSITIVGGLVVLYLSLTGRF